MKRLFYYIITILSKVFINFAPEKLFTNNNMKTKLFLTILMMPVVMPLILKGMCDSNPYMQDHQVSEYIKTKFLENAFLSVLR